MVIIVRNESKEHFPFKLCVPFSVNFTLPPVFGHFKKKY